MKKGGYGSIINMSSMSSINKSPAISAYAASKAAINHMTANLAHDYTRTTSASTRWAPARCAPRRWRRC
jgi:NAD(P)-dependent dehydrogenase (short-subunit alcohol dehydrogenase family)